METRRFGVAGDVPVIGQGTWQIQDNQQTERALRRGLELGMTHLDTAELYTGAEDLLSRVLPQSRERVFLVSKVLPYHASYRGTLEACEQSLRRLGTDHLDAYLLHWHDGEYPIEETMRAMLELRQRGLIRHIGVSNFDRPELEVALEALGDVPLVCNQVRYNLEDRLIEDEVLPFCEAHDIAVVGYSPYGTGSFISPGTRRWQTLERIGQQYGRTVRQVTLRYLTRRPSLLAIPKHSSVEHAEENAGGQGFELTPDDIAAIDAAFPR